MSACRVIDFIEAKRRLRPEPDRRDAYRKSLESLFAAQEDAWREGMRWWLEMCGICSEDNRHG